MTDRELSDLFREMSEDDLADLATFHEDDDIAQKAMTYLRKHHHGDYMFCWDCDGLVVRKDECCLNRPPSHHFKINS